MRPAGGPEADRRARWQDGRAGYGWISIALHWTTAGLILALLFIGDSIGTSGRDVLALHTSLAVTVYPLLVLRIVWRLAKKHPGPSPRQRPTGFAFGKIVHYALLGALGMLLLSGPTMACSAGYELHLFGVAKLPCAIGTHPGWHDLLLRVHATAAAILALLVLLHVCAVFKHLLVNRDETLERMLVAGPDAMSRR